MNDDQIVEALRSFWQFHPDARIDVERKGEHLFRVTEVKPDLSIGRRVVAYRHEIGGVVSCLEPDLTFEQARVYDLVLSGFAKRILDGESASEQRFLLMKDNEYPELFQSLDLMNRSLAGNVRQEMLPVWHSLENMLQERGYQPTGFREGDGPWEVWAAPLSTPPTSFESG